jgi:rhodanese-related sulfurtransferase
MSGVMLKRAAYRAVCILIVSISLALVINSIRPHGIDLFKDPSAPSTVTLARGFSKLSLEEAAARHSEKQVLFIDSRSPEDFAVGHIQGAINQPDKTFDSWADEFIAQIPADRTLITYCNNADCQLAENLAEKLSLIGYENVFYMPAGWDEWKKRALPMDILE